MVNDITSNARITDSKLDIEVACIDGWLFAWFILDREVL